ncbi:PREDICTED: uncharacterized protein LOC104807363 isoform X2 [Tarenaya hassleriana]|uniref:uncharacterized protein LOC104807363 isoform X2 n=1 Tax=Tarenaya hassleriana TaxID=28532 RepID=UPI00053C8893|nr:PREDICTED: uncharacterized protein LOC104807363 isoform X2 [Tarenaya hassleriana]
MRFLQQVQQFSSVCEDENNDDNARLGSDNHNNDKVKHIINKRDYRRDNHDSCFMADQEEPRTNYGSSSKDKTSNNGDTTNPNTNSGTDINTHDEIKEEGWLRLGISGQTSEAKPDEKTGLDHLSVDHQADPTAVREDSMLQLNLLTGGSSRFPGQEDVPLATLPLANTSFRIGPSLSHQYHHHQAGGMMSRVMFRTGREEMLDSWTAFRPPFVPQNLTPSPSLMMPLMGSYFTPSTIQPPLMGTSSYTDVSPSPIRSSFRVIEPPRRPHSGLWFVLQASQNQAREPFLPQIPKSYLRIKDGGMTVRLLMKYLVNKLQLEHESEIEIRCRGQQLEPVLTLQHVRDTIWRSSAAIQDINSSSHFALLPSSSTSHHLMVLHYGRSLF